MASIGSMFRQSTARMRHRISVKQRITSRDQSTGQPTEAWLVRFENEPAAFNEVAGGEQLRGRHIEAGVTAVFVVNYREEYKETDIIDFDGVEYGIVRLRRPDGIKRYLEIHAKATK